ncbi:hypothetical protein [Macrococcoides caseolyticum]|uniref:hypothetical protein n=1 Tax=Macrococcoides caseolyticum TaxID=69966 RepID=UPI0012FF2DD0|nr:hypothetical protein [Macrococcus caseolyticus]
MNNENWEVIFIDSDAVVVARSENGEEGIVSQRTIYKNWYEQQKQRADLLGKRWKNLKEHFVKEKEQSFGILSWSRNNGMLELIERLEEDDND